MTNGSERRTVPPANTRVLLDSGTIAHLVTDRGYGFIRRQRRHGDHLDAEFFFHRKVVEGGAFEDLHEGQTVSFLAEPSSPNFAGKGPRANRVVITRDQTDHPD